MDFFNNFWKMDKWDKIGIAIIFITFAIFSIGSCFAAEITDNYVFLNHANQDQNEGFGATLNNGQYYLVHNSTLSTSVFYIDDDTAEYYIVIPRAFFSSTNAIFLTSTSSLPVIGVACNIPVQIAGTSDLNSKWSTSFLSGYYVFNYSKINSYFSSHSYVCLTTRNSEGALYNSYIQMIKIVDDSISSASSSITGAINEQTNKIEEQTTKIEETTNSVNNLNDSINRQDNDEADSSINQTFSSVSSSTSEFDGEINNIVDFYKSLNNAFKNVFDNIVEGQAIELNISLPFVNKSIVLRSDIVRNMIQDSVFYVFLRLCYTTAFAFYMINSFFNIIAWLQSGEFLNGKFVNHKNLILKVLN